MTVMIMIVIIIMMIIMTFLGVWVGLLSVGGGWLLLLVRIGRANSQPEKADPTLRRKGQLPKMKKDKEKRNSM